MIYLTIRFHFFLLWMIYSAAGIAQEPPQANNRTSCAAATDGSGEASFNDDALIEEYEYLSYLFGENVGANDTVEDKGIMPNNYFCFNENYFIETMQ